MTATLLATVPDNVRELLTGASDDALYDLYTEAVARGDRVAADVTEAEISRRLRRDKRRQVSRGKRAAAEALWLDAAHAHFLAAEAVTCGNLTISGSSVGEPYPGLYRISDRDFARQASEEMRNFCEHNPRPKRAEYIAAAFAPRKGEKPWDAYDEEEAGTMSEGAGGLDEFTPAEPVTAVMPGTDADEQAAAAIAAESVSPGYAKPPRTTDEMRADSAAIRASVEESRQAQRARLAQREAERFTRATEPTGGTVAVPARAQVMTPGRGPVDAADLLGRVLEEAGLYLTDYVSFPSRSAVIAVVLWIAHAAARDAERELIWRASPRLLLTSEQNGSGKSTVLDLAAILLGSRAGRMVKVTPYGLAKVLGVFHEVGLPDDAQTVFGTSGEAAKELLAVLLGSYNRGGTWVSGKSNGKIEPIYGPVALAGKDSLITKQAAALSDLLARSVIIRLERPSRYMPQLDEDGEDRGRVLAKALAAVMGALQAELVGASRDLARDIAGGIITDGDGGRQVQIWRPLLAVARIAGGRWPEAAEQACAELSAAAGDLLAAEEALEQIALPAGGRDFWTE